MAGPLNLSPEQVRNVSSRWILVLPEIAPPGEVVQLREIFQRLFQGNVGWEKGAQYDLAVPTERARRRSCRRS